MESRSRRYGNTCSQSWSAATTSPGRNNRDAVEEQLKLVRPRAAIVQQATVARLSYIRSVTGNFCVRVLNVAKLSDAADPDCMKLPAVRQMLSRRGDRRTCRWCTCASE